MSKSLEFNVLSIAAAPVMLAVVGIAQAAYQLEQFAEAVGRELVDQLAQQEKPEALARAGVSLRRFETPIPLQRLSLELEHRDLQIGGTVQFADAKGRPTLYACLRRGERVVAAIAQRDGQTELLAAESEAPLVRGLVSDAIARAFAEAAAEQRYRVVHQPARDGLRLSARQRQDGDKRISLQGAWTGQELQLNVRTASYLPDDDPDSATGTGPCPGMDGLVERLNLRPPSQKPRRLPPGPSARTVAKTVVSQRAKAGSA